MSRSAALALLLCAIPAGAQTYGARPGLLRMSGIVLFYDVRGPLSAQAMTRRELPAAWRPAGEVRGRGCQHGLSIPLSASLRPTSLAGAAGDGGYERAVAQIRREHPELAGLYDLRADVHHLSILGVYRRRCVEVTARGLLPE